MAKILQLEPHVADLIAAGEVVERPASVIKELMENSIDAGATVVTVEIKSGGMTYMRVTDNGSGINSEDAETAFLRHATSKLRDEKGLEAISTLGFRGEALSAIAAVSRIELLTCETSAPEGTSLVVEGGTVHSKMAAGCPVGTTMIVRDLFFNTPARLKFMKTDRAEGAAVSAQVISCALSHPEVSVRYIKDGKEECHTPGDGRMDSCIYSLFGREFMGGMMKAYTSDGDVTVTGYVSTPLAVKGNRNYQFFFVNGRFVKSKTLQAALEQAYRNSLFTGKFPSCVLYVTLSPCDVDVNVHPTKTEVKFVNDHQVFDGVYYASLSSLDNQPQNIEVERPSVLADAACAAEHLPKSLNLPQRPQMSGFSPKESHEAARTTTYPGRSFVGAKPTGAENTAELSFRDSGRSLYRVKEDVAGPEKETYVQTTLEDDRSISEKSTYRVIGEALGTYVLAEKGDTLWLIDKHAAHERIHFDRLKNQKQVTMSQTLMRPVVCNLGREDTALVLDNAELFERLGFLIDAFGDASAVVRGIPSEIELDDVETVLAELTVIIRHGGYADSSILLDKLFHTIACKAAIKAGRRSEQLEIETLVARVLSGEVKYCPHGRPVAMEMTKTMLDRNFKRI